MRSLLTFIGYLAGLLASVLLSGPTAFAQVPPAWLSAQPGGTWLKSGEVRKMDADGNLYEVGMFSVSTSVGSTTLTCQGRFDGYLAKYAPNGTVAWVRQFSSAGEDATSDVALDAAGNAYVVGYFTDAISLGGGQTLSAGGHPGRQAFVVKYDPSGTPLWAQRNTVYGAVTTNPSCPPEGFASSVQANTGGQVVVTGYYSLTTNFGFGSLATGIGAALGSPIVHTYLARFSASTGAPLAVGLALNSDASTGVAVIYPQQQLSAPGGGSYLVTNYFMATSFPGGPSIAAPASADILVARYSATGQLEWARTFGGPDYDNPTKAATDAAGNLYLVGTFRQSLTFGATTLPSAGQDDAFLVKYSPQGQEQWARTLGGRASDFLYDLCFDASGNVFATGNYYGTAQVAGTTLASAGGSDVVVLAFTPQGQLVWTQRAGGPDNDYGFNLGFVPSGRLCVYGTSLGSTTFGALAPVYGNFVAELAAPAPLAAGVARSQSTAPYPNPASSQLVVPGAAPGTRLDLLDALGRLVSCTTIGPDATVSVLGISPGVYTLRATTAQGQPLTGRVVVGN